tara:strand:- start:558 stop:782 length:225 start_codon:yes stop_codon:yes gene_type:complete
MNKIKWTFNQIFSIFDNKMKKIIYKILGEPIPRDKGVRGTSSGKLYIDKKVFYKRKEVQDAVESMKKSFQLSNS